MEQWAKRDRSKFPALSAVEWIVIGCKPLLEEREGEAELGVEGLTVNNYKMDIQLYHPRIQGNGQLLTKALQFKWFSVKVSGLPKVGMGYLQISTSWKAIPSRCM